MQNEKMSRRKVLYILLSVLIAAAVWFYVDEFGNNGGARLVEQRITDIPIEYTSEDTLTDRGLMLLKDGTSQTIDLTFKGSRRLVTQLDRSKVRVTVDLSGVSRAGVQGVGTSVSISDRKFLLNNNVIGPTIINTAARLLKNSSIGFTTKIENAKAAFNIEK